MTRFDAKLVLACVVSAAVAAGCNRPSLSPSPQPVANTEPTVSERADEFVGSAKCAECHREQHESYLRTTHSRSLSIVDPAEEPADGEFLHEASGRTYRVYREDGELRHHEALLTESGETVAEADYAVKYLVGSGAHTRSYLVEIDGFLSESPITWYDSLKDWSVSPGYDVAYPPSFERAADVGCLVCHVGSAEPIDGSTHRVEFHELAIGCERCHGPGRAHVAAAEADQAADELAATIANPSHLSRTLTEDICAQCHLRGDATIFLPDKNPLDFRPGEPLSSVRVDYFLQRPNSDMKVVGHVEQMRLSACYTQSETLTCTTCHEMHSQETTPPGPDFYRTRCLDCHAVDACGLPESDVQRVSSNDNCVACHMPQTKTDIPHIAFTHHRIGLHADEEPDAASSDDAADLVPFQEISHLPYQLRQRCLGLGWLEVAAKATAPSERKTRQDRGLRVLDNVSRDQELDGDAWACVAKAYWDTDPEGAIYAAGMAFSQDSVSPEHRTNADFVLADIQFQRREWQLALAPLEELIRLRRHSEDHVLLGLVRHSLGQPEGVGTLEAALEINPFRDDITEALGNVLRQQGREEEAALYLQRAADLRRLQPQPPE